MKNATALACCGSTACRRLTRLNSGPLGGSRGRRIPPPRRWLPRHADAGPRESHPQRHAILLLWTGAPLKAKKP